MRCLPCICLTGPCLSWPRRVTTRVACLAEPYPAVPYPDPSCPACNIVPDHNKSCLACRTRPLHALRVMTCLPCHANPAATCDDCHSLSYRSRSRHISTRLPLPAITRPTCRAVPASRYHVTPPERRQTNRAMTAKRRDVVPLPALTCLVCRTLPGRAKSGHSNPHRV